MKKIYALFALAASMSPVAAQLSSTTMAGVGSSQYYTACDTAGTDPGAAGMGVTWDFSAYSPSGSNFTVNYNNPTGHPQAGIYPTANMVEAYTNQFYRFMLTNADSLVLIGEKSVANTPITYDNFATLYLFPMNFGYYHQDSVHGTYPDGFISTVDRLGEYIVEVDGQGTLITPVATYNNVLRVRTTGYHFDSSFTGAADVQVITQKNEWYVPGTLTPVCIFNQSSVSFNGGAPQIGKEVWYADTPNGIEPGQTNLRMTVFPSVTDARTEVAYTLPEAGPVSIQVMNASGALVESHELGQQAAGAHGSILDLQGKAAGIYLVRVQSGDMNQVKRLVLR